MVLVPWKDVLKCVGVYRTVSMEAVFVLAGIPPIELIADNHQRVYGATRWINLGRKSAAGQV